ncbi:YggS family pyridoxal phosphate-dependent enzyme [Huintestinicola sp.]|uniref:YggS family pyridoxal phosphate-dependent enzyme n=1 Tax=Huintestinicola sp. TaxID=2981661 RepID=UPI003D7D592C
MNNEFEDISENIKRIRFNMEEAKVRAGRESDDIKIMAVTKTVPAERVNFAVSQGFELLGENRVQEFLSKKEQYVKNAEINFIGHLQSNKIKYIIDSVTMIQSVDSTELAKEISARAVKQGRVTDILCEVNIGGEASKSGFSPEALHDGMFEIAELPGVRVCGLMTIPPPSDSCVYFEKMQRLFEDLKAAPPKNSAITLLSMGMSSDYTKAVKFGTGMVRLGTALFGARNYSV